MTLDQFLSELATRPDWSHLGTVTVAARGLTGDTPLHTAIWENQIDAARLLIDAGADVNAPGEDGYTPLHAAIAQADVALARRLTERGASWDAVNKFECSVRDAARRSDDPGVKALFEQEQLVSTLPGRIGHFRLESGHHSDLWLDLELLCLLPEFVRQRAVLLARRLAVHNIDIVCGPLVEGAYVGLLVALELGTQFTYAERIDDSSHGQHGQHGSLFPVRYQLPRVLRDRVRDKRLAIVNDVISAGSAVRGTLADVRACGAIPVAVGTLAVMGSSAERWAEQEGVAFESLASFPHSLWPPSECPLCKSGVPLTANPAREIE
jgi:orotate phosphoribosyltransferase